jgi:hypothetical protein
MLSQLAMLLLLLLLLPCCYMVKHCRARIRSEKGSATQWRKPGAMRAGSLFCCTPVKFVLPAAYPDSFSLPRCIQLHADRARLPTCWYLAELCQQLHCGEWLLCCCFVLKQQQDALHVSQLGVMPVAAFLACHQYAALLLRCQDAHLLTWFKSRR